MINYEGHPDSSPRKRNKKLFFNWMLKGMAAFYKTLQSYTNEPEQVTPFYTKEIGKAIPKVQGVGNRIENNIRIYPHFRTDGIYRCYYINDDDGIEYNYLLQIECKLDEDFTDLKVRAEVLLQVCCYLKQIHDKELGYGSTWESNLLPKVIVLGSKKNCLAIPAKLLIPYAMGYIAGFKSASTAHELKENSQVLINIANDANIQMQAIVYDTSDTNCINRLCEEIVKIGKGLRITDDLSEHTVSLAFDFFDMYVLEQKSSSKLSSREKVDLFIGTFFNEEFEETKTNRFATSPDKLKIHGITVKINPDKYNQFKLLYNMRDYSGYEQKQITAITDRLIEDTDRRRKGDFYTPSIWVDEAHKLIKKNLGADWRDEYMVWDCAWGTGNLTRDYKFADLYCSTIQEEDLNIGYRYNKGATKFQYDFLNDDVEDMEQISNCMQQALRMRESNPTMAQTFVDQANAILFNTKLYQQAPGLIDGLLGINGKPKKKLLFLINPPYGTSGEMAAAIAGKEMKSGIAETKVNELMTEEKIGTCSRQLVAQFMYRINLIKDLFNAEVSLGMFSPTSVLTSNDYEGLLNKIDNHLGFTDGIMFCASEFADVQSTWGIMFSLYSNNNLGHNRECVIDVMTIEDSGKAEKLFSKKLYMINKKDKANYWVKEPVANLKKTKNVCYLKSAISVTTSKAHNMCIENYIGGFMCDSNNINNSAQFVSLFSAMCGAASGLNLGKENYDRVISLFTARKLITGQYATWINSKDEYMIPDTSHPAYEQWQSDCIVYSLFNTASNQSSLRNISYNGKQWNIQNEFFWMSVKDMEELAGGKYGTEDINTVIENDLEAFGKERFVYKKLQEVTLSPDAKAVLDKATELVKSSFKYRKVFNQHNSDYHINTWDAGWYQIKALLKDHDPEGLKEFNNLYKELEDRMRPLVYELGFLYK